MKKILLVLSLLLFNPVFGKVIISSPQTGSYVDRGIINVLGVTDEVGEVELSLYNPSGFNLDLGSFTPNDFGFWNATIDLSFVDNSSVYLIASTMLDKSNVLINLRDSVLLDLSVPLDLMRGNSFLISGEVVAYNGSSNVGSIPLIMNNSVDSFSVYLDYVDGEYVGTYLIPYNAPVANWSVIVNYSSSSSQVISDVESFQVLPTNFSIDLVSDYSLGLGSHEIRLKASYPSSQLFSGSVIDGLITGPGLEPFNIQFDRCGNFFCKNLLFDQPGKWFLSVVAEEFGNYGSLNTSIIVSNELTVEVLDSSLFVGDDTSFLVSVSDADGLVDDVSFSVSGLPANISQVVMEDDFYRVYLDLMLPAGEYDFSLSAFDELSSSGSTDGLLVVNDLVVSSCVNDFCVDSAGPMLLTIPIDSVEGSVLLSDGSVVDAELEIYVNGVIIDPDSFVDGLFSSNVPFVDGFMMVLARYNGLVRSNSFFIADNATINSSIISVAEVVVVESAINSTIEFPALVNLFDNETVSVAFNVSNNGLNSINVSFNDDLPSWVSIPDELIVAPGFSASDFIVFTPVGVETDFYPLRINGEVNGVSFSENLVVIIDEEFDSYSGDLSIGKVSFDVDNSGLVIEVANFDSSPRELFVNSSGESSSLFVDAFDIQEVFIPFNNLSNDLSLVVNDSVVFCMDSYFENVTGMALSVPEPESFSGLLLIIAYPIFIVLILVFFYFKDIKSFMANSFNTLKKRFKN